MSANTVRSLAGERLAGMGRLGRMGKNVLVDLAEKQLPPSDEVRDLWFVKAGGSNALLVLTDRRVMLIAGGSTIDVPLEHLTGVDMRRGRIVVQGQAGRGIEVLAREPLAVTAAIRAAR